MKVYLSSNTNFAQGAELQGQGDGEDIMEELEGIADTNSDNFHSVGIGRFKLTGNDQLVCIEWGWAMN